MLRAVAIAWAAGIFVGDVWHWSWPLALGVAGLALVVRVWSVWRGRYVGWSAVCLAVAGGSLAGALRPLAPEGLIEKERAVLVGRVAAPPLSIAGRVGLLVDVDSIELGGMVRAARARVHLSLHGPPQEQLLPGDVVRVPVRLHAPRGFANPGAPDAVRRAAMLGVVAGGGVHDAAALVRLADAVPSPTPERALLALRQSALSAINAAVPEPERGLVAALAFGERAGVGEAEEERWRRAGVSHVLSVSGLHLSLVTLAVFGGLTWLLLRIPRFGRRQPAARWAAPASLLVGLAYTILTGAEVATVRAMLVAGVFLGAILVGRRARLLDALFAAVLSILVVSPLSLFDPSFQLSVAACLGMALLATRATPAEPGLWLWRWLRGLLRASVAALAATLPITAWHFSELQPGGLLSNVVVVPLAELVVVPVGLAGGLSSVPWPALGRPLLLLAGFAAQLCGQLVGWFSWLPSLRVPAPTLIECALYYALLLMMHARRWRWAALLAAVLSAAVAGRVAAAWLSTTVEATFVDIGQGDAAILMLPGRKVVIVDGGGSFDPSFDPGRQVLAPLLWRRGVHHIDLLILSHPHPDHANGLGFLVENFSVGEVWTNGQETRQPGTVRLLAAAARRGIPVRFPHPLGLGGAHFFVHGPRSHGQLGLDPDRGENDNSLVIEVAYGGRRMLLSGDVEARAEAAFPDIGRIDVLKVPHHGSRTSSTTAWLAALRPSVAVISVGLHNQWGFPHATVLARYQALGTTVYRTDTDGAVTVSLRADGTIGVETQAHLDHASTHGAPSQTETPP